MKKLTPCDQKIVPKPLWFSNSILFIIQNSISCNVIFSENTMDINRKMNTQKIDLELLTKVVIDHPSFVLNHFETVPTATQAEFDIDTINEVLVRKKTNLGKDT